MLFDFFGPRPRIRQARGEETIARITGSEGKRVVDSLRDLSPDLGSWIVNFAYGDVFSRSALNGISAAREVFDKRGVKIVAKD